MAKILSQNERLKEDNSRLWRQIHNVGKENLELRSALRQCALAFPPSTPTLQGYQALAVVDKCLGTAFAQAYSFGRYLIARKVIKTAAEVEKEFGLEPGTLKIPEKEATQAPSGK